MVRGSAWIETHEDGGGSSLTRKEMSTRSCRRWSLVLCAIAWLSVPACAVENGLEISRVDDFDPRSLVGTHFLDAFDVVGLPLRIEVGQDGLVHLVYWAYLDGEFRTKLAWSVAVEGDVVRAVSLPDLKDGEKAFYLLPSK